MSCKSDKDTIVAMASFGDYPVKNSKIELPNSHGAGQ
jgi:hypothetical protein